MKKVLILITILTLNALKSTAHDYNILTSLPYLNLIDSSGLYSVSNEMLFPEFSLSGSEIAHIYSMEHQSIGRNKIIFNHPITSGALKSTSSCATGNDVDLETCVGLDHFEKAVFAAMRTCVNLSLTNQIMLPYGAVPVFNGPIRLISPNGTISTDHHLYTISEGVNFYCNKIIRR